jgi:catechol 2,3-dioxygenase-like lactoylglutathione lyase family enzyme
MDFKLELIPIPVSDVDRAKRFYADECGFVVDLDHQISESLRIVQLTPAGSGCSIMLGTGTDKPPGSIQGIQLVVSDIDAARAQLVEGGVEITPVRYFEDGEWKEGHGGPWNSFAFFDDPDGNGWVLQERP